MVETTNKANLLEAVEKGQYEIPSVAEAGCVSIDGLAICEYSQIVLAHANSWILATTLTNGFLYRKGWVCLGDVYKKRTQGSY